MLFMLAPGFETNLPKELFLTNNLNASEITKAFLQYENARAYRARTLKFLSDFIAKPLTAARSDLPSPHRDFDLQVREWSLGAPFPFCEIRLKWRRNMRKK